MRITFTKLLFMILLLFIVSVNMYAMQILGEHVIGKVTPSTVPEKETALFFYAYNIIVALLPGVIQAGIVAYLIPKVSLNKTWMIVILSVYSLFWLSTVYFIAAQNAFMFGATWTGAEIFTELVITQRWTLFLLVCSGLSLFYIAILGGKNKKQTFEKS